MSDNAARKFRVYGQVFGLRGYWLAIKTRFSKQPYEVAVKAPEGPIFLRLKTSDLNTYDKVFLEDDYAFNLKFAPKVIVDAGANIGFASIYFARRYPDARIYAVEPERSNFELLQRNVQPYRNITPLRGALWNEDTTIDLVDPGFGHWAFQVSPNARREQVVEKVPAFRVSTLLREHRIESIDLLKVDIEGAEKELFSNAGEWIDKVRSVVIELHDRVKPGCSESFFSATAGFPLEERKGENIFRSRGKAVAAQ